VTFTVENLTIADGAGINGGAIGNIFSLGSVTVTNSTVLYIAGPILGVTMASERRSVLGPGRVGQMATLE
jgi:hypothetical protein